MFGAGVWLILRPRTFRITGLAADVYVRGEPVHLCHGPPVGGGHAAHHQTLVSIRHSSPTRSPGAWCSPAIVPSASPPRCTWWMMIERAAFTGSVHGDGPANEHLPWMQHLIGARAAAAAGFGALLILVARTATLKVCHILTSSVLLLASCPGRPAADGRRRAPDGRIGVYLASNWAAPSASR